MFLCLSSSVNREKFFFVLSQIHEAKTINISGEKQADAEFISMVPFTTAEKLTNDADAKGSTYVLGRFSKITAQCFCSLSYTLSHYLSTSNLRIMTVCLDTIYSFLIRKTFLTKPFNHTFIVPRDFTFLPINY